MYKYLIKNILFLMIAITISGCLNKTSYHGQFVKKNDVDNIKIGKTSMDDISNYFGDPSFKSRYGDKKWYYVSSKFSSLAFFKSEVIKRDILAISFDKNNVVSKIKLYNLADGQNIVIEKDMTKERSLTNNPLQYLVKNLGRFENGGGIKPKLPQSIQP